MYRNQDLDEVLRKARPQINREFELNQNFNNQVMQIIGRLNKQKPERLSNLQELRIAGASLVLAGLMLLVINATPLGQDLNVLAASVKSTTVKVEQYRLTLPGVQNFGSQKTRKEG